MAHILMLETLGNDMQMLETAVQAGHEVTFFTGDLHPYLRHESLRTSAIGTLARDIVVAHPFCYELFEEKVLAVHEEKPFDAVLCPIDTRLIEASRIAERLGLIFLNTKTTAVMRDKFRTREHLAKFNIKQPRFLLATTKDEIKTAVQEIGFPAMVKLADGFGSVGAMIVNSDAELEPISDCMPDAQFDYGLGVYSNGRMLVEEYVKGQLIGCDTLTVNGEHVFLGVHSKSVFRLPYFGIRGSSFPSARFDVDAIKRYVFSVLDALDFDFGAAHMEIIVTDDGLYLVEVNPRMVGAHVARLVGHVFDRSIYADVMNLHLGKKVPAASELQTRRFGASRWITANKMGTIVSITPPVTDDPRIKAQMIFKMPGDYVRPPFHTGDRIGYVMAVGETEQEAEDLAEEFIRNTQVVIE
jgi:biotin carboxylase